MTFSLHQRGEVMSSQIMQTQLSTLHPLVHVVSTCVTIFSSCTLFTVYPKCIVAGCSFTSG